MEKNSINAKTLLNIDDPLRDAFVLGFQVCQHALIEIFIFANQNQAFFFSFLIG